MEKYIMLHKLIKSDIAEIGRLRELSAALGTADPSKEHVSGGPLVQCRFAEIIHKIVDLEAKVREEINEYLDMQKEVRDQIAAVKDPVHRMFLRYKYIEGLSHEDIAIKMGYSVRQIYRIQKDVAACHLLSQETAI